MDSLAAVDVDKGASVEGKGAAAGCLTVVDVAEGASFESKGAVVDSSTAVDVSVSSEGASLECKGAAVDGPTAVPPLLTRHTAVNVGEGVSVEGEGAAVIESCGLATISMAESSRVADAFFHKCTSCMVVVQLTDVFKVHIFVAH